MNKQAERIKLNDVEYVRADTVMAAKAESIDEMPCVIARTYSAGVFCGYLESRNGKEVVLRKARRLWMWVGAASLSELAMRGSSNPSGCKFPCEVDKVLLTEVIEILDVTAKAKANIDEVPVWTA